MTQPSFRNAAQAKQLGHLFTPYKQRGAIAMLEPISKTLVSTLLVRKESTVIPGKTSGGVQRSESYYNPMKSLNLTEKNELVRYVVV